MIKIDPAYKYALIAGNNLKYLWVLSREKSIPASVKEDYLKHAAALGYDVDKLVWTRQD